LYLYSFPEWSVGVMPQTPFPLARSEIAEGDVRIGEVMVWGGGRTQIQQEKNFREKNTGKKTFCLLTGSNPQANRDSNNVLMCWWAGLLVCWYVDMLICWCADVLMGWSCWFVDMLICWCADVLIRWYLGSCVESFSSLDCCVDQEFSLLDMVCWYDCVLVAPFSK
jgi:hypothetical protein